MIIPLLAVKDFLTHKLKHLKTHPKMLYINPERKEKTSVEPAQMNLGLHSLLKRPFKQ